MVSFALIARVTFFSCPPLFLLYNFRSFLGPDSLNMVFLTVGVPTDRKHITGLDNIAYFDLLHNIGEKLERIGRLNNIQRIDLLEQAEAGGSIGWHMLWTEEKIISSTCSASCEDMYWAMVSIVEPDQGVNADILTKHELRQLVKDLRIDMKELGKLERFQVTDLFRRLKALDYVRSFMIQEEAVKDSSLGNDSTNLTQPTPPSFSDPSLQTSDAIPLSSLLNYPPVISDDFKSLLNYNDSLQRNMSSPLLPNTNRIGACCPAPAAVPTGSMGTTPGLSPSTSNVHSPQVDEPSTPSGTVNSPQQAGIELDLYKGYNYSLGNYQAGEVHSPGSMSSWPRQRRTTLDAINSNTTIFQLLRSCKFAKKGTPLVPLSEKEIQEILEVEPLFFTQDPVAVLEPILEKWEINLSHNLHGLGLPLVWKGIQGAVNYLRVLDNQEKTKTLQPIAERFALIFFSLNYYELCKHPDKYCPGFKPNVSSVLNCILTAYPDDPRLPNSLQSRRNKISGFYARRGNWWWMVGATLGVGLWLIPDDLIRTMSSKGFKIDQIHALATLSLNTRPGSVRMLHSLEPVVKYIMLGEIKSNLWQAILDGSLLERDELICAYDEDQKALASQQIEFSWRVEDTISSAGKKMTEFLAFLTTD
ncbi:hypothetical protein BDV23DRAFT_162228 [Aspergillus alliaceus]|uniref:Uncharacterized protein n=1 Tax=Petromyces alliaceus TaxID=209559 RepID=A0A5N7BYN6_PETAA|nr:hypothetical protein BDV23DRAFT_162228 [Aspergillus alliaceus]